MTRNEAALAALQRLQGPLTRLQESLNEDAHQFPLRTTEGTNVDRKAIDAVLQRFQQAFDLLAWKAMPLIHAALQAEAHALVLRDLLDAMERLDLIDSADDWEAINDLRNLLVHEYAMVDAARVEKLNEAWKAAPLLIAEASRLKAAMQGARHD